MPLRRMEPRYLGPIIAAVVLLAAMHLLIAHDPVDQTSAASSAYDFGYGSAAISACPEIDPGFQNILAARVSIEPSGRVADDIVEGFKAFSHALDTLGTSDACATAIGFVRLRLWAWQASFLQR